ncbi:hypothetical protein CLOSTMETH_01678 [[Clostridium] methylpentosum DSM 5476]|uniref:Uncharacterized protein n=1 Tax=[Clostridium] methylpentosum DSM 5476 TaxID=537013 RepID=C0ECV7_9FIRM|nr:hypothetical protein CLOSTMETH_01678 [[Clostridium] methylpentosum DSM 5476]
MQHLHGIFVYFFTNSLDKRHKTVHNMKYTLAPKRINLLKRK